MTRLSDSLVEFIGMQLDDYDRELLEKTGFTLKQIACFAAGINESEFQNFATSCKVAVIPITSGKGLIKGFSSAVRVIINHLGCGDVFITKKLDVAGLAEAVEGGAKIIFLADDNQFVAINLYRRKVVDNAEATGRGYVVALEGLKKGLDGESVLVIGGGRVGESAVCALQERGAKVAVFDIDQGKVINLKRKYEIIPEENLDDALSRYSVLFDASPACGIVKPEHIRSDTVVAAPGIPPGLTTEAHLLIGSRIIHDPLQIGVATMYAMALTENNPIRR